MLKTKKYRIKKISILFANINDEFLKKGAKIDILKKLTFNQNNYLSLKKLFIIFLIIGIIIYPCISLDFYAKRCIIPNNYLIWEFTRPLSNCDFCRNIKEALILENLSREEFEPYAYSSRPIVLKNATASWKAREIFNLQFFREIYEKIDGAYESIEEECQFLPFKSNFSTLKEVLNMPDSRAINPGKEDSWYVGWKNCHSEVLEAMKGYYEVPKVFPEDAEISNTNYIFMGYDEGAIMHLDYISRLMWQGQLIGKKTWYVAPTPECDKICSTFNFSADTGDIILLDTRIWYHATQVENDSTKKTFSLTISSEYG